MDDDSAVKVTGIEVKNSVGVRFLLSHKSLYFHRQTLASVVGDDLRWRWHEDVAVVAAWSSGPSFYRRQTIIFKRPPRMNDSETRAWLKDEKIRQGTLFSPNSETTTIAFGAAWEAMV